MGIADGAVIQPTIANERLRMDANGLTCRSATDMMRERRSELAEQVDRHAVGVVREESYFQRERPVGLREGEQVA